jgi:hypothetical protein
MGPFFRVQLIDSFLCCEETQFGSPLISYNVQIANNPLWNELIDYLQTRKWKGDYKLIGSVDGTQWDLEINMSKIKIKASGSNKFPPGYFKFMKLLNKIFEEVGVVVY